MTDLAVIIPFALEWPQIVFTIRAAHEDLVGIDHKIIVVDNFCYELEQQEKVRDRASTQLEDLAKRYDWLNYLTYQEKLSHWCCKNLAIANTNADIFLFLDGHVVPKQRSLRDAFTFYRRNHEGLDGTLHLPLTYHILEEHQLIYSLVYKPEEGICHYTFCGKPETNQEVFEVPCMSSCGMFMTRNLYNLMGQWHSSMTAYGGGENDMNFTLATIGKKHWIYNPGCLHHHGDKREYSWNWLGYNYNRALATYKFGGEVWMWKYLATISKQVDKSILPGLVNMGNEIMKIVERPKHHIVMTIEEWSERWL
jgi:hypothetical protein